MDKSNEWPTVPPVLLPPKLPRLVDGANATMYSYRNPLSDHLHVIAAIRPDGIGKPLEPGVVYQAISAANGVKFDFAITNAPAIGSPDRIEYQVLAFQPAGGKHTGGTWNISAVEILGEVQ